MATSTEPHAKRPVRYRESMPARVFDLCNAAFGVLVCAVCLYPFIYLFSVSISSYESVGLGRIVLWPHDMRFEIYEFVFRNPLILRAYLNSILYATVFTVLVGWLSSMAGFVLAEDRFRFKRSVSLYLAAMLFFEGGLIPVFLWIRTLGMVNTLWAIVLPTAVNPFFIFIFRTSIRQTVHQSLKDSVYIDGGGDFLIYLRIVLPLIVPILATIGLFAAVSMWNEFFRPMVYLYDQEKMPLTIVLRRFLILRDFGGNINSIIEGLEEDASAAYIRNGWLAKMRAAIVIVSVAPILLVYPFIQRYFVRGIMIGAIKE